ncbi:MAG: copper resistance CopC family protein [Gaiellales bacterium]
MRTFHLIPLLLVFALAVPTLALAHAVAGAKTPAPNAILAAAPATVRVAFSEPIRGTADALIVVAADGTRVSGPAAINGRTLSASLNDSASGRYAYAYTVESLDGHVVSAACAYAVRSRTPAASAVPLTFGRRQARLSGNRVGLRTLRLWAGAKEGTVRWTSPLLAAPFVWTIHNGVASGLLPFAGAYTVEARVRTGTFSESITTTTTTITP